MSDGYPTPKRAFWTAFGLSFLYLVAATAIGPLLVGSSAGAAESLALAYPALLVVGFVVALYLASQWGGRHAVYGVLAGFLGTAAFVVLFVAVCAIVLFRSFG